jgi:hypothetical protein
MAQHADTSTTLQNATAPVGINHFSTVAGMPAPRAVLSQGIVFGVRSHACREHLGLAGESLEGVRDVY